MQAQAIVVSSYLDEHPNAPGTTSMRYRVQLRVTFPDGSTEELGSHVGGVLGSWPVHAGDVVPVRYDPADHSKIEVDEAALQVQHEARTAAVRAAQVYSAEIELRKATLQREIAARSTPPSDGELEEAVSRAAAARARARESLNRSPLSEGITSDEGAARHRDLMDYDVVKTEFRALWALRPDWAPVGGDPTAPLSSPEGGSARRVAAAMQALAGTDAMMYGMSCERFDFAFAPMYRLPGAVFGVRPTTAWVEVRDLELYAQYGPWQVTTPLANIRGVSITGPYAFLKTAGPARLGITDRGLSFTPNGERGVLISFAVPVRGLDPFGVIRHPELTLGVSEPERLHDHLTAAVHG